jgi:hypothetical protein
MGLQYTLPHNHTHAPTGSDPLPTTGNIHQQYYERNSDADSQSIGYGNQIHQVVLANDTRLSNARTPSSHSHGVFTNLASGFVPDAPLSSAKFLRGDATWQNVPPSLGNLHLRITGTTGLFNTNNSTEHVFPWNEIFRSTDPTVLSPSMGQFNILISPQGAGEWYRFEARYSSWDITNPAAFMRIRLRMSTTLIAGANGGTLMGIIAQGRTGTATSGEASISGSLTLQISSPTYCVFTILHDSAAVSGYPVFSNDNGLQPYIYIRRLGL